MRSTRTKRMLAFLMSVILTFTTFTSDFSSITAIAEGKQDNPLEATATTKDNIKITKSAAIDGDEVMLTFKVEGASASRIIPVTNETAVVFVMDMSNSMMTNAGKDRDHGYKYKETRLYAAKEAAKNFAEGLLSGSEGKVSVGVVAFGTDAFTECGLSKSIESTKTSIDNIGITQRYSYEETSYDSSTWTTYYAYGGTNLQAGLKTAKDMLAGSNAAEKIIVVLSDGEPTYNYKVTGVSTEQFPVNSGTQVNVYSFDYSENDGDGREETYSDTVNYFGTAVVWTCTKCVAKTESDPCDGTITVYDVTFEDPSGNSKTETRSSSVAVGTQETRYTNSQNKKMTLSSATAAYNEAKLCKDEGISIFSIGYDVTATSSAGNVMQNVANANSTGCAYNYIASSKTSTDVSDAIGNVLNSIQESIEEKVAAADGTNLSDELPSYMSFDWDSVDDDIKKQLFDYDEDSFKWDLLALGEGNSRTITVNAKLDIAAMINDYASGHDMSVEAVREAMSVGSISFPLNKLVTLKYTDIDKAEVVNTDINVNAETGINVPVAPVLTYPYTINYTLDGEATDKFPAVTGYGYNGEDIAIDVFAGNDTVASDVSVKRGEADIAPVDGAYSFDVDDDATGANNVITVALHSATNTVTFLVDGVKYDEQTVKYGEDATAPEDPEKEGYTFTGWDKTFTNVTTDLTVTAQFLINHYNVAFVVYCDETKDEKQSVTYKDIEYKKSVNVPTVTIPNTTEDYAYTAGKWMKGNEEVTLGSTLEVTENATYTYVIGKEIRKYDVNFIFIDEEGNPTTISSKNVSYGTELGEAPSFDNMKKADTPEKVYSYSGWYTLDSQGNAVKFNPDDTVSGTTFVYVKETSSAHPYTITYLFKDCEGNIETLESVPVVYGQATPACQNFEDKKLDNTNQYTYSYDYPAVSETVTGNAEYTYTETRTVNKYSVSLTVVDGDARITVAAGEYDFGYELKDLHNYTPEGKDGHTGKIDDWKWNETLTVTEAVNLTSYVKYEKNEYTVNFVKNVYDTETGAVVATSDLDEVKVLYGEAIGDKFPEITLDDDTDRYVYSKGGWDATADTVISGDTTVTYTENRALKTYDVTFTINYVEEDGTAYADAQTETTSNVKYGTAATAALTLPAENDLYENQTNKYEYSYTVSPWDTDFSNITGTTEVMATVTRKKIEYTVTFNIEGQNSQSFTEPYGTEITMPAVPQEPADATFTYTVERTEGWVDNAPYTVTADKTFEAKYKKDYINYDITLYATNNFDDADHSNVQVGEKRDVHFDANVVNTEDIITDSAYRNWYGNDEQYEYTLSDFEASYTVTEKGTVKTAVWLRTPVNHTITYVVDDKEDVATYPYDSEVTVMDDPTKTGHTFEGWTWTKADGTEVSAPEKMPEYDLIATANFKANTYKVIVNYVEVDTENVIHEATSKDVTFGKEFTVEALNIAHFAAINDSNVCGSHVFDENLLATADNETVEYTIFYKRDVYTVNFFDCSSEVEPVSSQDIPYEGNASEPTDVALPEDVINEDGTVTVSWFTGWDKSFINVSSNLDVRATYDNERIDLSSKVDVTDDADSTIKGVTITGNMKSNDKSDVKFEATTKTFDFGTVTVNENGEYSVEATKVGTGSIDVPFTVNNKYEYGPEKSLKKVLTYSGTEKLTITVYDSKTIAVDDRKETYDGTEYSLTVDTTGFEDVTYTVDNQTSETNPSFKDAGKYSVIINAKYTTEDGKTYDMSPVSATLTIDKRKVSLISGTRQKAYDGTPLSDEVINVGNEGFVEGEGAKFSDFTKVTLVCDKAKNDFKYTLNDNTKADNYIITQNYGTLTITENTDAIVVKVTGNTLDNVKYDGTDKEVLGYTCKITGSDIYTENDFTFEGEAYVSGNDAGSYYMNLSADQFNNANKNFGNVTFVIEKDGCLDIAKRKVTLTSATDSKPYDGTELANDEITVTGDGFIEGEGFETVVTGTITNAGSVDNMFTYELTEGTLSNNYDITPVYGKLTVTPVSDKVTVTITENSGTLTYNGDTQSVTGYTFVSNNELYTEKDFEFRGNALASGTDAGYYEMELTSEDFVNTNTTNFTNVEFKIVDGGLRIDPIDVTVTIKGNTKTSVYDGTEQTAEVRYTVTNISNSLYTKSDFTFNGTETVSGTDAKTYPFGLTAENFKNNNKNFETVAFEVQDGSFVISPAVVKVTITGNEAEKVYNGTEQLVEGYAVTIPEGSLYKEDYISFTGTKVAKATNVSDGTVPMNLDAKFFGNTNTNFEVEFDVTDGAITITPLNVTVDIKGNSDTKTYTGEEFTLDGYRATASSDLFDVETDLLYNGQNGTAGRDAGKYPLTINSADFYCNNTNFNVKFNAEDGLLTINPVSEKVIVKIEGDQNSVMYDGKAHNSIGYTVVSTGHDKLSEADIALAENVEAKATSTNADKVFMELSDESFVNNNKNFSNVVFDVEDGYIEVTKRDVILTSASDEKIYDAEPLTNSKIDVSGNGFVRGEGYTAEVTGSVTHVDDNKENNNAFTYTLNEGTLAQNYDITTVFGTLTILPIENQVTVTIVGDSFEALYDGEVKGAEGYNFDVDNALYNEDYVDFNGNCTVIETDAGTYPMGLKAENFENNSSDFTNVIFDVTDGGLVINKRFVLLTSATDEKTYDTTALTNDNVTASGDGFAENEGAEINVTGTVTHVSEGTVENAFEYSLNENTKASNYSIEKAYGTLKINPFVIDLSDKNYDDEKTYDATGYANTDTVGGAGTEKILVNVSEANSNAGVYDMTLDVVVPNKEFAEDYVIILPENKPVLTINKRDAYVDIDSFTKNVGEADPAFTYSVREAIAGDVITVFTWRTIGAGNEVPGSYTITARAPEAGEAGYEGNVNYNIHINNGTLTIVGTQTEGGTPTGGTPAGGTPTGGTPAAVTPVEGTPEQVVEVEEEAVPMAEAPVVEETVEPEEPAVVEIPEEEVPLAIEAKCWIHWLILGLTLIYAIYAVARATQNKRELDDEAETANN